MSKMKWLAASLLAAGTVLASPAYAGKLKVVEVISSPDRSRLLHAQLEQFHKANPGTEIELITIPWDGAFEKVLVMFKSGQIPDVIEMPERWSALYIRGKQLEPLDKWLGKSRLPASMQANAMQAARFGTRETWQLPYGFYLKAMFYNKKLLAQAGVKPPQTQAEFVKAVESVSKKVPGKYGYCLRGGKGGGYEWMSHAMTYGNSDRFFDPQGNSLYATPGFRQGMQMVVDFYQKGYAPKESISWGFNEIVTGFYSGTCAFLAQDPDALIGIAEKMDNDDFGVIPMPRGSSGYAYPNMGFAGWAITRDSKNKDEAWKLIEYLASPQKNLEWAKIVGILPVHKGAEKDPAFSSGHWAAWFRELSGKEFKPFMPPSHLPEWGALYDKTMVEQGQAMLLGKRQVADVAQEWAKTLTAAQQKFDGR